MTISSIQEGSCLTLMVEGSINSQTSPEFEKAVNASLENADRLILDFSEVNYISSAGLRVIISAHRWMEGKGGSMVIRGVSKSVLETFELTGFDSFLTLEPGTPEE